MNQDLNILEEWIKRTAYSWGCSTTNIDSFRNPVGHALRLNLTELWYQISGEMNWSKIDVALDSLVRIRALHDISPERALDFLLLLKPTLHDVLSREQADSLEERIDEIRQRAFRKYAECRERLTQIRAHELQRAEHGHLRGATRRCA